jgi:hypothetical protein
MLARLLFVGFVLMLSGVILAQEEDESNWVRYEDPAFTITAPAEWTNLQDPSILGAGLNDLTENNPDLAPMLEQAYTFIESGGVSLYLLDFQTFNNMSIAVTPPVFGSIDLQEIDQELPTQLASMGIEVIDTSTVDLPAGEALLLNARAKVNLGFAQEETVEQTQYIFVEGGRIYVVAFTSFEEEVEENISTFQHIINTFEIIGSEGGWERVTWEDVSFRKPEGWEAIYDDDRTTIYTNAEAAIAITIMGNGARIDRVIRDRLDEIENVGGKIEAQQSMILPSGSFERLVVVQPSGEEEVVQQYIYFQQQGEKLYEINFYVNEDDFEGYVPLFEQIIDTFVFEEQPAGTDVQAILESWKTENIIGDSERGRQLYAAETPALGGTLPCTGCHLGGNLAPSYEGKWERASTVRLEESLFEGYTPEQYLVESIVQPGAYIVPEYTPIMPQNFGERLSSQDIADIIAYFKELDGIE